MGKTVDIVDIENSHKRTDKALRGHGYTGNLVAFKHSGTPSKQSAGRTVVARFKAMQPTGDNDASTAVFAKTALPLTPSKSVENQQSTPPGLEQALADLEQAFLQEEDAQESPLTAQATPIHDDPDQQQQAQPTTTENRPSNHRTLEQSLADLEQKFAENEGVKDTSHPAPQNAAMQDPTLTLSHGMDHDPLSQKKTLMAMVLGSLVVGAILGSVVTLTRAKPVIPANSNPLAGAGQPNLAPDAIARALAARQSGTASDTITPAAVAGQATTAPETIAPEVVAKQATTAPEAIAPKVVAQQPEQTSEVTAPAVALVEPTPAEPSQLPEPPTGPSIESQVASYQEEINWLNKQNLSLTEKVNLLSDETLTLNKELLQLEIATVTKQPKPRVVYNFVNVPIGDDGAASNAGAVESYSEPVVYQEDNNYADDSQYTGDAGYSESLEYRPTYEYEQEGEPVYDPETGLYLSPEMLNERENQQYIQPGSQVVYPPVAPVTYSQ